MNSTTPIGTPPAAFFIIFFGLVVLGLMLQVVPQKPRPTGITHFFRHYWSELMLILFYTVACYFFMKGSGM